MAALRDDLLPAWNGTAWAMNGTSQVPGRGSIACGYFVSTTLMHAGFRWFCGLSFNDPVPDQELAGFQADQWPCYKCCQS